MRLDVKRAAALADCSPSTIYAWLRDGRLAGIRVGARGRGVWRIEPADLDAFLTSCRVAAKPVGGTK